MSTPVIEQVELKPSQLVPHKNNIRVDVGDVSTLAESIKAQGVISPLLVTPNGKPDRFVVLAGHRRLAAAKLARQKTIPCIVRVDLADDEPGQIAAMIGENVEREDLSALEEAKGVQMLLDLGETAKTIAARTGMSSTRVRNRVKIGKLSDSVQEKLATHAVTLADAVFVADHAGNDVDLAEMESALGTNNWGVTKQRVLSREAARKSAAKLRKDAAASGLCVVEGFDEARDKRSGIATQLTVRERDMIVQRSDWMDTWSPPADLLDKALQNTDLAIVFLNESWRGHIEARIEVFAAPVPDTVGSDIPATPATDATAPAPDTADDQADEDDREPAQPSAEDLACLRRQEDLAAATKVRAEFVREMVAGGKLEHARLVGQFAPIGGDWIEVSWSSLVEFLPLDADALDDLHSVEEALDAVTAWFDTQNNPSSLLIAMSWMFLQNCERPLATGAGTRWMDFDDLRAMDRYGHLLTACGYTFSDIEQELLDDYRLALAEENSAALVK